MERRRLRGRVQRRLGRGLRFCRFAGRSIDEASFSQGRSGVTKRSRKSDSKDEVRPYYQTFAIASSRRFVLAKMKLHQLISPQSGKSVSLSRVVAELDLEGAVFPSLNNCSDFPAPKSMRGDIFDDRYQVQQFDFIHPIL